MKLKVRVANPASGCLTYIPFTAAQQYVARDRARWRNGRVIEFLKASHSHESIQQSARIASQVGYDRVGQMTFKQIAGIPVVDAEKLLA